MLNSLLLAAAVSTGSPCAHLAPSDSPVGELVALAWQEAAQRDKRHEADLQEDLELGKKYSVEVEKELKLSKRQDYTDRVAKIGDSLGKVARENAVKVTWGDRRLNPFAYSFKVVENKDVNAFSLPGGFIYVYEGLIEFCESEDELAGVLAHEIAHASFRHLATLRREAGKLELATLPLILVVLLGGGGRTGTDLMQALPWVQQASGSGWSIKAEQSADYGGVQYMRLSEYNPVGLLTFMERLARKGGIGDVIDLGIFRTHPPSKERAGALTRHLNEYDIPIRRSEVTTTFRAVVKPGEEGAVEGWFGGRKVFRFGGEDAIARADTAVKRLNAFFDSVPELHEIQVRADGTVLGRRQKLFQFTPADAEALKKPISELANEAGDGMKRSLYTLAYRIWDSR